MKRGNVWRARENQWQLEFFWPLQRSRLIEELSREHNQGQESRETYFVLRYGRTFARPCVSP